MRGHGKLAVLKDDEVERLEVAARSTSVGVGRAEMMDSMYGRLQPKPQGKRTWTMSTLSTLLVFHLS